MSCALCTCRLYLIVDLTRVIYRSILFLTTPLDFQTSTVDQVIDGVLEMDKHNSLMSMGALQRALPKDEDLLFHQAVQCTTCLNPDHSTVECTTRTHCMLCHSRSHTMDRCEYILLNRQATIKINILRCLEGSNEIVYCLEKHGPLCFLRHSLQ